MAKPKTKGPTIQFRLPLYLHSRLERLAADKTMTPTEYAADYLTRALQANIAKDTP